VQTLELTVETPSYANAPREAADRDRDILDLLAGGELRAAFELVVDRYQNKVFRLAVSMLRNESIAEDVAQDVFLKVWRALPGYQRQASLSTWIYTIARNTCLTQIRRLAARPTVSIDEPEVGDGLEALPEMHTSDEASGENLDIPVMLDRLPEHYRRVLVLFYLEQRSYEEVSIMMGIPLGTVKTYLHRARKELVKMSRRQAPANLRA
jgi:RNA polymerase sigma-70 factor (ECF subfamily)